MKVVPLMAPSVPCAGPAVIANVSDRGGVFGSDPARVITTGAPESVLTDCGIAVGGCGVTTGGGVVVGGGTGTTGGGVVGGGTTTIGRTVTPTAAGLLLNLPLLATNEK